MGRLTGMKQITGYYDYSEATILSLIRNRDFPAQKISGQWESDTELIDQWRREQIKTCVLKRKEKRKKKAA